MPGERRDERDSACHHHRMFDRSLFGAGGVWGLQENLRMAPRCRVIYDKFHIMQHANDAVDEVRRAEFFRKGRKMRDLIKGKKWLLLSRWKNLAPRQRGVLNRLFQLNRRVFKAYMLKESLERLWDYRYERAMVNYLGKWTDQLRWQRLPSVKGGGKVSHHGGVKGDHRGG